MAKRKQKKNEAKFLNRPLAGLKQAASQSPAETAKPEPVKPSPPPPEDANSGRDENLFSEAMTGVKPMENRRQAHRQKSPALSTTTVDEQESFEVMQSLRELVDGELALSIHETGEAIEGTVEDLDPNILTKLRRGDYSVQDHLDLHGYTREQAREKVEAFLHNAIVNRLRCVLIVHGRGLGSDKKIPVLKNALKTWFTRRALRKKVLAFTTAQAHDGGAGAIYVLLKNQSRQAQV